MSGDEKDGGEAVQVDRPAAEAGIAVLREQATTITKQGESVATLFEDVIKALATPVDDEPAVEVPAGIPDVVREQAKAVATRVTGVADNLQSWVDTTMTVQRDGAQAVEKAGSGCGGSAFAGVTASGTVDVGATASGSASVSDQPTAANPGMAGPAAFTQK